MAAYAAAVTLADNGAQVLAGTPLRILRGRVDVTNYNSTLAAITDITKYFKSTPQVILGGVSDNGYLVAWVPGSSSIKAWAPRSAHSHTLHFQTSAAANAVTAAANALRTAAAAFDVAGVANSSGEGGIVTAAAGAGDEAATDTDVGAVDFIAIGI